MLANVLLLALADKFSIPTVANVAITVVIGFPADPIGPLAIVQQEAIF